MVALIADSLFYHSTSGSCMRDPRINDNMKLGPPELLPGIPAGRILAQDRRFKVRVDDQVSLVSAGSRTQASRKGSEKKARKVLAGFHASHLPDCPNLPSFPLNPTIAIISCSNRSGDLDLPHNHIALPSRAT
jgi:hypothetical protein